MIIASVISILIASIMVGGGHGWVSVFPFCFLPLLITPLTVHAYIYRKKLISFIVIGLYVLAMYVLYFMTLEEGEGYFERVLGAIRGLVILFFIFWLSPFLLNICNLFRSTRILQP